PAGFYFNNEHRLTAGIAPSVDQTYIWATVLSVIGNGNNNGSGNFVNGTGPVVLNGYVPSGVILTQVIPVFDNSLESSIIQECIIRMELQQDFSLVFDNSLAVNQDRWSIRPVDDSRYFVKFVSESGNRYS